MKDSCANLVAKPAPRGFYKTVCFMGWMRRGTQNLISDDFQSLSRPRPIVVLGVFLSTFYERGCQDPELANWGLEKGRFNL